jgi:hypothetical protein
MFFRLRSLLKMFPARSKYFPSAQLYTSTGLSEQVRRKPPVSARQFRIGPFGETVEEAERDEVLVTENRSTESGLVPNEPEISA